MRLNKRKPRGDGRSSPSSRATVGSSGPQATLVAASRFSANSASLREKQGSAVAFNSKRNARQSREQGRAQRAEGRAAKSFSRADGPGDAPIHLGGFGRKLKTRARFTSVMACRRVPAKNLGAVCCPQLAVGPTGPNAVDCRAETGISQLANHCSGWPKRQGRIFGILST